MISFLKEYYLYLVFLSEPQLFHCNSSQLTSETGYKLFLNSEDSYNDSLPLDNYTAHGGMLALWPSGLDAFVTILPTSSPAIIPLLFQIPQCKPSVHIGIYLSMSSHEDDFIIALSTLCATLYSSIDNFPNAEIYI